VIKFISLIFFGGCTALGGLFFLHFMTAASNLTPPTLVPDLVLFYSCSDPDQTQSNNLNIDVFLKNNGFLVQDVSELQRELGMRSFSHQSITAVDQQHRMMSISGEPNDNIDHQVTLFSEPPTVHSTQLELSIQNFISNDLHCTISNTSKGDNSKAAADVYNREFFQTYMTIEQLFPSGDDRLAG
jgi:hypothetical protein